MVLFSVTSVTNNFLAELKSEPKKQTDDTIGYGRLKGGKVNRQKILTGKGGSRLSRQRCAIVSAGMAVSVQRLCLAVGVRQGRTPQGIFP